MKNNTFLTIIFALFCTLILNTLMQFISNRELLELKKESLRLEIQLLKIKRNNEIKDTIIKK